MKTVAATTDPAKLIGAMASAVLFVCVHALMPGHGKSVLVSYYLGRPSRMLGGVASSALLVLTLVGMAVTLVLAGFIVIRRTLVGAGRMPVLEIISLTLIIAIGLFLFVQALWGAFGATVCSPLRRALCHALLRPSSWSMRSRTAVLAGLLVTAAMAGIAKRRARAQPA